MVTEVSELANLYTVGGRNVEHLKGNIEALKLRLSPEEIKEIESAYGEFS